MRTAAFETLAVYRRIRLAKRYCGWFDGGALHYALHSGFFR
jgi:hypothetical protein